MARFWKYCPVCLHRKIGREIVNTCGSRSCTRAWRTFSIEQKDRAEQVAEQKKNEVMAQVAGLLQEDESGLEPPDVPVDPRTVEEIFKEAEKQQLTRPIPTIPDKFFTHGKTVERDNEFLKKVFGEDAPGVVEPENEDKEEK